MGQHKRLHDHFIQLLLFWFVLLGILPLLLFSSLSLPGRQSSTPSPEMGRGQVLRVERCLRREVDVGGITEVDILSPNNHAIGSAGLLFWGQFL